MNDLPLLQNNPVEFIEVFFNDNLWQSQKDILESVRDNKATAVRSSHGIGKSFVSARAALWFLYTHPNSKVITTAPSFRQVEDILWREIAKAKNNAIIKFDGQLNQTSLDIGDDWFALGLSTDKPDRFQGFHAIDILLVIDEAAGVEEKIFEASEGIISSQNAKVLYIGNPTSLTGSFYQAFRQVSYNKIKVSAFDTPNFTENGITLDNIRDGTWQKMVKSLPRPYLVTPDWVADRYAKWGEGNPLWESRVLGEFPTQGSDTLIPLVRIEAAVDRELEVKEDDPRQIGADIARFGENKTIFYARRGGKIVDSKEYNNSDTMTTAQRLNDFAGFNPGSTVCIDVVGLGSGVFDRVKQLNQMTPIVGINVGIPSNDPERFFNLRAEYYVNLRERFINGDISIPNDEELVNQLAGLKFTYTPKGQYKIESKEEMSKRGLISPDKADALALTFGLVKQESSFLDYMRQYGTAI